MEPVVIYLTTVASVYLDVILQHASLKIVCSPPVHAEEKMKVQYTFFMIRASNSCSWFEPLGLDYRAKHVVASVIVIYSFRGGQ